MILHFKTVSGKFNDVVYNEGKTLAFFIINFASMIYRIFLLVLFGLPVYAQSGDSLNLTDINGLKQGLWEKNYENSPVKRYSGQFKDDKPFGTFLYYYLTGELRTKLVYSGEKSKSTSYHLNGEVMAVGNYFGQTKDSTWLYYNEFGEKVAMENFIRGKRYGPCFKYHPNGQLLEEKYFERDLENGVYREFYHNGILAREGTYVFGSLEGKSAFYHPNGKVRFEGVYYHDAKEGIWKTYDEEGNLTDERKYTRGVPEYRESDLILEDTLQYYRKDYLELEDFIDEDYMDSPPKEEKKDRKK